MNKSVDLLFEELKSENKENEAVLENAESLYGIINEIVSERVKLGLTQRDLAKKCNMKQSALARIEKLQVIPRLDTVIRIAQILDIKLIASKKVKAQVISIQTNDKFKFCVVGSLTYNSKSALSNAV